MSICVLVKSGLFIKSGVACQYFWLIKSGVFIKNDVACQYVCVLIKSGVFLRVVVRPVSMCVN